MKRPSPIKRLVQSDLPAADVAWLAKIEHEERQAQRGRFARLRKNPLRKKRRRDDRLWVAHEHKR